MRGLGSEVEFVRHNIRCGATTRLAVPIAKTQGAIFEVAPAPTSGL